MTQQPESTSVPLGTAATEPPAIGPANATMESAGPKPVWQVPLDVNPFFTGRDQLLAELHDQLRKPAHLMRTVALVGPAGIGKTQVAVEYAHRHRASFDLVCWLRAESEASLEQDVHALARELFGGAYEGNVPAARAAVREELGRRSKWLLVFDGCSDPAIVTACLPPRYAGQVLITTRNPNWRGVATVVPTPLMERNESMFFLRQRTGRTDTIVAVGTVAKALGDLPLALELAATYVNESGVAFDEYVRQMEQVWADWLARGRGNAARRDALGLSLELSVRRLATTAPASETLLNLLAFFAHDGFRRAWLPAGDRLLGEPLASTVRAPAFLDEAIGSLIRASLLGARGAELSVSPAVAAFLRERLPQERYAEFAYLSLRLMDACFRFDADDPRTWAERTVMLPHALAAVEHSQRLDVTVPAAAALLNQIGQCLLRNARYEQARAAFDRALSIAYRIYGDRNPRLSPIANNLGRALMRLGDVAGARQQFEWALWLDEQTYGATHPHVAEVLNNLGLCLTRQALYEEADAVFARALAIYEGQFGPSHPSAASIVNNMGYVRMMSGDSAGARELFQRALGAVHAARGPNHPDVASVLLNLGDLLREQGSFAAARAQYQRAMLIDEICYGPNHPDVARDAAHLGAALLELKEVEAARKQFERAVAIDEAIYGREHANLVPRLQDLGRCLKLLDDVDGSAACYGRASEIARRVPVPAPASPSDSDASPFVEV